MYILISRNYNKKPFGSFIRGERDMNYFLNELVAFVGFVFNACLTEEMRKRWNPERI